MESCSLAYVLNLAKKTKPNKKLIKTLKRREVRKEGREGETEGGKKEKGKERKRKKKRKEKRYPGPLLRATDLIALELGSAIGNF